jgi:hypothetical protein
LQKESILSENGYNQTMELNQPHPSGKMIRLTSLSKCAG